MKLAIVKSMVCYSLASLAFSFWVLSGTHGLGQSQPDNLVKPQEVSGEPKSDDVVRGLIRTDTATSGPTGHRYAFIVGIDYSQEERTGFNGAVTQLAQCEKDARELKDILVLHYGYEEADVRLLLGRDATRQKIMDFLNEEFLCKTVKPEDSVLFYFAGHGERTKLPDGKPDKGYLWPVDVDTSNGAFKVSSAIQLSAQVEYLGTHCLAKHKLAILDCCHAGSIFETRFKIMTDNDVESNKLRASIWDSPAFQAIAAARAEETAVDNYSYTKSLIKALRRIPARLPDNPEGTAKVFTASQLWRSSRVYLESTGASQSPQCRWLDSTDGEFLFFPDPNKAFKEEENPQQEQALLLSMVPSTFGNWWMDEVPWFMPGLRLEIVKQLDRNRGSQESVSVSALKKAASRLANDPATKGSRHLQSRLLHMSALLESTSSASRKGTMERIIGELEKGAPVDNARFTPSQITDLHYRAVLHHKLQQVSMARTLYQRALQKYEELIEEEPSLRPLQALCRLDHGYFLLTEIQGSRNAPENIAANLRTIPENPSSADAATAHEELSTNSSHLAAEEFRRARTTFGPLAPYPFQIFTLMSEAKAQASAGRLSLANSSLKDALDLLNQFDPNCEELFTASTQKDAAWHYMTQWQFSLASQQFHQSQKTLENIRKFDSQDFAPWISLFHVEHGLAMIERYSGNSDGALRMYRRLTPMIKIKIHELDGSGIVGDNYLELRTMLTQRLSNSLERQGDCNLFARKPNYAEAADDFRIAATEAEGESQHRYHYKRALALSLNGSREELKYAAQLLKKCTSDLPVGLEDRYSGFCRKIATLVNNYNLNSHQSAGAEQLEPAQLQRHTYRDELRKTIDAHRGNFGASVPRDDLEMLMFASRILLNWDRQASSSEADDERLQIEDDSDQLLRLCRLAHESHDVELTTLNYLRPYFEQAFLAKSELGETYTKELIEIAWEATRGTDFIKPTDPKPLLVVFTIGNQQFFLLDNPTGKSGLYVSVEKEAEEDLLAASIDPQSRLVFPDLLRKELRELRRESTLVHWRDPTIGLGYKRSFPLVDGRYSVRKLDLSSAGLRQMDANSGGLEIDQKANFPFQVYGEISEFGASDDSETELTLSSQNEAKQ